MKTYSTKANANRAAKAAGLDKGTFNVLEIDGRFVIECTESTVAQATLLPAPVKEAEAPVEAEVAEEPVFEDLVYCPHCNVHLSNGVNTDLEAADGIYCCLGCNTALNAGNLKKSSIENPVKAVWEIADTMWGSRRKDTIKACVDAGIAYNTARTQYQAFYKVKSKEAK